MAINKNQVSYQTKNSYETLNKLSANTKNVWFAIHGMGYLSRYFSKYFRDLNPEENYIIIPQAPSKYYLKDDFKHVGASWLTKEDTPQEIDNLIAYLDAIKKAEHISDDKNLILFGFSQGVSVALRWWVRQKLSFHTVILYAGGIPNEIRSDQLDFIHKQQTKITLIYGDQDQYITPERFTLEKRKIEMLFKSKAETITFEGGHEIKPEILQTILEK